MADYADATFADAAAVAEFDEAASPIAYRRSQCAVFRTTKDQWGGLSNMAAGYPIVVNDVAIRTSEALYQACRLPHLPSVQQEIIAQPSPIAAKMKSRAHHKDSRADFYALRVPIMWWSLRVKLACNPATFAALLLATDGLTIIEHSHKDEFWGTVPTAADDAVLLGRNILGRLLGLLRDTLDQRGLDAVQVVPPLTIPDFVLYGEPIRTVRPPR
jgi:ribA/ribD-fused uncharacterized protein